MNKIHLKGKKGEGLFTLVDKEDFEKYGHHGWCITSTGYVVARINKKNCYLHRLITNCPKGLVVDHINHDKLDNQKSNLRVCTIAENAMNSHKHLTSSNNYKGVKLHNPTKTFQARIQLKSKQRSLGYFKTEEEAAMAYNEAAYVYFGEFAKLNKVIL